MTSAKTNRPGSPVRRDAPAEGPRQQRRGPVRLAGPSFAGPRRRTLPGARLASLFAASLLAISVVPCARAEHFGLLVGINEYKASFIPARNWLVGCDLDVSNILHACTACGDWSPSNVSTLVDSQATKAAERAAISNLASRAVSGDTVLIYHSSHGGNKSNPYGLDVYLCDYDARYSDAELAADLLAFRGGVKLVMVVDACHSGGLFKSSSSASASSAATSSAAGKSGGDRSESEQPGGAWNLAESVSAIMEKSRPSVFAKGSAAAAGITASEIGWITAADYDQLSLASMRGSIFTRQLSRGWISGAADCDESGTLDFRELYLFAKDAALAYDYNCIGQCHNESILASTLASVVPPFTLEIEDGVVVGSLGPVPSAVAIPDGVTGIAEGAFTSILNVVDPLESVTIPSSVTNIESYAFYRCPNLRSVVFLGDAPAMGDYAINGIFPVCRAFLARGSQGWRDGVAVLLANGLTPVAEAFLSLSEVAEVFGPGSEEAAGIATAGALASFNGFLARCGVTAPSQIAAAEVPHAFKSYRLSRIAAAPGLYSVEPVLAISSIVPGEGGAWGLTVTLSAGGAPVALDAAALAGCVLAGVSPDAVDSAAAVASAVEEGDAAVLSVAAPSATSGFFRIKVP